MVYKYDYLVIGSGIAGMSFALKAAKKGRVAIICKTTLEEANTALAQGGVASVTNLVVDVSERGDTPSSAYSIMPTTPAPRSSAD